MLTTKQELIVDTQKLVRLESKYNTKERYKTTKEKSKGRRKRQRTKNSHKIVNKWQSVYTYL